MNQHVARVAEETHFTIANSPIWKFKVEEFSLALVQDCCRELELNGYDDASSQLQKYFGIKNETNI